MKKFFIKDSDGCEYEVKETDADELEMKEEVKEPVPETKDSDLSGEELAALKKLATVADKLVALAADKTETTDEDEEEDLDEDVDVQTMDEDIEEEKIIKTSDSKSAKKSFGSIETKKKLDDSYDSKQFEISEAWAKRYGGTK